MAVLAAHSLEEPFVHLAEEPDRDGEAPADTVESVFHREHVVVDLDGVVLGVAGRDLAHLEEEELADVGLGALDPRAEHGLQAEVRTDEQVRVGDEASHTPEAVHGAGCLVEELDDLVGERHPPRYLRREERPVPGLGLAHFASCAR
jgi:hypothetical protein